MDLNQAKIDYERDGVALIPGVFTKPETDCIRAAAMLSLWGAGPERPYKSGERLQFKLVKCAPGAAIRFPSILFWPALLTDHLNRVRIDPAMVQIVRAFLGPDVKQLNNQVYYRMPGDGDAFNWHQDAMFRKGLAEGHSIGEDYLQTVICVDEMDGGNGGLMFLPGTHKRGDIHATDKAHLRERPDIFVMTGLGGDKTMIPDPSPGDVLIWNVYTVHGSLPNESSRPRMTYMNGFCRARSSEAWPWYLKDGVVQPVADPETIPYT